MARTETAIKKALAEGEQHLHSVKLCFVGHARAGKTSTLSALAGRPFDPDQPSTEGVATCSVLSLVHSLRIYPYPMVWPLPRPWSETTVSIPLLSTENPRNKAVFKGFLGLERPFLDLVSQTPRPRGRGRPSFAVLSCFQQQTERHNRQGWGGNVGRT